MSKRGWRRIFLRSLADCGSVTQAARDANVHPKYASRYKRQNPRFARRWAECLKIADRKIIDDVEQALIDRAVNGRTRTILVKGKPVTIEDKPSDKAAIAVMQARSKRYRKQTGNAGVNVQVNVVQAEQRQQYLTNPAYRRLACELAKEAGTASLPASPAGDA